MNKEGAHTIWYVLNYFAKSYSCESYQLHPAIWPPDHPATYHSDTLPPTTLIPCLTCASLWVYFMHIVRGRFLAPQGDDLFVAHISSSTLKSARRELVNAQANISSSLWPTCKPEQASADAAILFRFASLSLPPCALSPSPCVPP